MAKEMRKSILILQAAEEMRHPYEGALASLHVSVGWFQSLEDLVEAFRTLERVAVVIVDLDALGNAIESTLEKLTSTFKSCDLIALSSSDSAQMALQCLRSGFADYLLKPTSPEELSWCIRKRLQNHELFRRLEDEKIDVVRAITQISNCTTPSLVRFFALEFIARLLKAEGGAWVQLTGTSPTVLCASPREINHSQLFFEIPKKVFTSEKQKPRIFSKKKRGVQTRKVFFPGKHFEGSGLFLWGIKSRVTRKELSKSDLMVEQAELSLINIEKFEQIKHQTFVDDLTGLYNSRYLKFALTNSVIKCKEPGQSFSVLFIDIDHFKKINDAHGHIIGSEFLVAIGRTVRNAVRRIDPVFRYGGDEFVVILNGTGVRGAQEIAERIRKNIERRVYVVHGQRIQTTVSIGIATYPLHANEKDTLLKLADEAMYSAKKESRNSVHLAVPHQQRSNN
jgi:two-component system, cell cycle response regulator